AHPHRPGAPSPARRARAGGVRHDLVGRAAHRDLSRIDRRRAGSSCGMTRALVLTYHAIGAGPPPLFVEPSLLATHLDCVVESRATVLTVSRFAAALREGSLPERAVALTFDDGFANVHEEAAPLLAERGLTATVFCVAGHLGGRSDWPSQPPSAPRL